MIDPLLSSPSASGFSRTLVVGALAALGALWPQPVRESLHAAPLQCLPPPDCNSEATCCVDSHTPDIDLAIRIAEMRRDMYADPARQAAARNAAYATAADYYKRLGVTQNPDGSFNYDNVAPPKDPRNRDGKEEKARQDLIEDLEHELESKSASNMQKSVGADLQNATSDYNKALKALAEKLGATVANYESSWTTDPDSCNYSDDGNKAASDREGGKYCVEVIDAAIEHEKFHSSLCRQMKDDPNSDATRRLMEAMGIDQNLKSLAGTAQDERASYAREALALLEKKLAAREKCLTYRKKDPEAKKARDDAKKAFDDAKKAFDGLTGGGPKSAPTRKESKSGPKGLRRPWEKH